ncbi:MAG: hypothetical protein IPO27_10480 [Bacteroidetes bacterium]|nr:hypothetical protein [Bacteroidota bacterium]
MRAQTWKQLGLGGGGQVRALNYDDKGVTFDLYVASDVAGVWKATNIDKSKMDKAYSYNYQYISNHRIMNTVNKLYNKATTTFATSLFVGYENGIELLNKTNNSMSEVLFDKNIMVSDIYISTNSLTGLPNEFALYYSTGDTRIDDKTGNQKDAGAADFYLSTISNNSVVVPIGYINFNSAAPIGTRDVYCVVVDEGTNGNTYTDDSYLVGTEWGLQKFNYDANEFTQSHSCSSNPIAPPSGVTAPYKVSDIVLTDDPNFAIVTIYESGPFLFNRATSAWTSLESNDYTLKEIDKSTVTTSYSKDLLSDFVKVIPLSNSAQTITTGFLLVTRIPDIELSNKKYFTGVFYCDATTVSPIQPNGYWVSLDCNTNEPNEIGWVNSLPSANRNSVVATETKNIFIGKSGSLYCSHFGNGQNLPNVLWQQIYAKNDVSGSQCYNWFNTSSNNGFVNVLSKAVHRDLYTPGRIWLGDFDRYLAVSDDHGNTFAKLDISENKNKGDHCISVVRSTSIPHVSCDDDKAISDCTFIINNDKDANDRDLYFGLNQGFGNSKGQGGVYILNTTSNKIEIMGPNICGDVLKLLFGTNNDKYILAKTDIGSGEETLLFYFNEIAATWDVISFSSFTGNNRDITDAIVLPNGELVVIGNGQNQGVHRFTGSITSWAPNGSALISNQVCIKLANYEPTTSNYFILVGTNTNNNNVNDNVFVIDNNTWSESPVIPNLTGVFQNLNGAQRDIGVSSFGIDPSANKIYVATVKPNGIYEKSHLYAGTYDNTGAINTDWKEITGNIPNRKINYINTNGSTIDVPQILISLRGMGEMMYQTYSAFITTNDVPCQGTVGNATANGINGVSPYTYTWNTVPVQLTQTATGLPHGTYTVTVTDADGKTVTATAEIFTDCCVDASETPLTQADFNTNGGFISKLSVLNENVVINDGVIINFEVNAAGNPSRLKLGGGVSITVNKGGILNIDRTLFTGCSDMWKGIINNGGKVNITNKQGPGGVSTLQEAEFAVRTKMHGGTLVEGSQFQNNYISLIYENGDYEPNGAQTKGIIHSSNFVTNQVLKYPHTTDRSFAHIYLSNCQKLEIGSNLTAENTFGTLGNFNCDYGIYSEFVDGIKIRKNIFKSFNRNPVNGSIGSAIFCNNRPKYGYDLVTWPNPVPYNIEIGDGNVPFSNLFENCRNAITLISQSATIKNNSILNFTQPISVIDIVEGINIFDSEANTVNITENVIINEDKGMCISAYNNYDGQISINNNYIKCYPSNTTVASSAIRITSPAAIDHSSTYRIANNGDIHGNTNTTGILSKADNAIYASNVPYLTIAENRINLNHVSAPTDVFGVKLENCNGPIINCNLVKGTTTTDAINKSSIQFAFTPDGLLECNTTDLTQWGLKFLADCNYADIRSNTLREHERGLTLGEEFAQGMGYVSGVIGDQGLITNNTETRGNIFIGPFGLSSLHSINSFAGIPQGIGVPYKFIYQSPGASNLVPPAPYTLFGTGSPFLPTGDPASSYTCQLNCQNLQLHDNDEDEMEDDIAALNATGSQQNQQQQAITESQKAIFMNK